MKVKIVYNGGPRANTTEIREMKIYPRLIGCKDDADANGMHGVYERWGEEGAWEYIWKDVAPKQLRVGETLR